MLIRKNLTVVSEHGNEFAQQATLRLPDGKRAVISNVYIPPQNSLNKRQLKEKKVFAQVSEVLTTAPTADHVVTVGDFNARTGTLAPCVGSLQLQRTAEDPFVCPRAKWMLDLCELTEVHILNGAHSRTPAPYTCFTPRGKSAVDYVLCNSTGPVVRYDADALQGLSDHTLLWTSLPLEVAPPPLAGPTQPPAAASYRWDVGPSIQDQIEGIKTWKQHTEGDEFRQKMLEIVENTAISNAERSDQME